MPSEKDIVARIAEFSTKPAPPNTTEIFTLYQDEAIELIKRLRAGVPEGWPTEAMIDAAIEQIGWKVEPYTAPRESGVAVECDITAEDAADLNQKFREEMKGILVEALAAAPPPPAGVEGLVKALELIRDGDDPDNPGSCICLEHREIASNVLDTWRKPT